MPVPEILTEAEALRFLRVDSIGIKHPAETLRYYRKKYGLKGVQIGKALRFTIGELRKLVKRLMDENPR